MGMGAAEDTDVLRKLLQVCFALASSTVVKTSFGLFGLRFLHLHAGQRLLRQAKKAQTQWASTTSCSEVCNSPARALSLSWRRKAGSGFTGAGSCRCTSC